MEIEGVERRIGDVTGMFSLPGERPWLQCLALKRRKGLLQRGRSAHGPLWAARRPQASVYTRKGHAQL